MTFSVAQACMDEVSVDWIKLMQTRSHVFKNRSNLEAIKLRQLLNKEHTVSVRLQVELSSKFGQIGNLYVAFLRLLTYFLSFSVLWKTIIFCSSYRKMIFFCPEIVCSRHFLHSLDGSLKRCVWSENELNGGNGRAKLQCKSSWWIYNCYNNKDRNFLNQNLWLSNWETLKEAPKVFGRTCLVCGHACVCKRPYTPGKRWRCHLAAGVNKFTLIGFKIRRFIDIANLLLKRFNMLLLVTCHVLFVADQMFLSLCGLALVPG